MLFDTPPRRGVRVPFDSDRAQDIGKDRCIVRGMYERID